MAKDKRNCTSGGWGINQQAPKQKKNPPIWPGVWIWLLVGVIILIQGLFSL